MSDVNDSSLKILVVDDHPAICDLLEDYLVKKGHEVVSRDTFMSALEETTCMSYDMIIADINLPGGSGLELLREVRATSPTTYTVMITGEPSVSTAVDCMHIGAEDYLSKPIDFSRLETCLSDLVASRAAPASCKHFIADYLVVKPLGQGSMGVVYLCEKGGKHYALKLLHDFVADHENSIEMFKRFEREARVMMTFKSPHIVSVYDYGVYSDDKIPYLVMEYLEGDNLEVLHGQHDESLDIHRVASIGNQMALALEEIHAKSIIHRDMKPSNIMLLKDGTARLMDFGMARVRDSELTMSNALIGTPKFMAPETLSARRVDTRADIYSLGATLYTLFLGQPPLDADKLPAMLTRLTNDQPPPPSSIDPNFPPTLSRILSATLSKSPGERYPRAKYLAADLNAWMTNPDVSASKLFCSALPDLWAVET